MSTVADAFHNIACSVCDMKVCEKLKGYAADASKCHVTYLNSSIRQTIMNKDLYGKRRTYTIPANQPSFNI